ncbi:UNVERIFIED_ORG: conjugal transfer pilus assembly protein TraK [Citrobacter freundii]
MKKIIPGSNGALRLSVVALLCGLSWSIQAAPSAQASVKVPVSADIQARIALSNTQPNLLVVPGDRIVAVDSAQGTFTNAGDYGQAGMANGGVVLMTEKTAPFTFYVRTEGGLVVSIIGQPQARDGRVVHLMSDRPVRHKAAAAWERSHDYVALLVDVQRTLMRGELPVGYVASPVAGAPAFSLPAGLAIRAESMWSGDVLRVYRYRVSNRHGAAMALPERLFSAPGVRSVVVSPWADTLLPGASADVWVTVGQEEVKGG